VPGIPDLILITETGQAVGVEIKRPGGRLSAEQKKVRDAWEAEGVEYNVIRSLEEFIILVERLENKRS